MFALKITKKLSKIILNQSKTKFDNVDHCNAKEDNTPISIKSNNNNNNKITNKYSPVQNVLDKTGYKPTSKIASTLQGSVYNAVGANGKKCVLKRASVKLHNMGIACVNNKFYKVSENIINEAKIMEYLTSKNPPPGLTKFIDFFCDNKNYFLLMEHGGESLLKHVTGFHQKINTGKIKLKIWKQHVKILFKQMCIFINWLHNIANLVHLDISLENILIKGCVFKNGRFKSHGQIHFIDFGLSKCYKDNRSFDNCSKYVGKQGYQSPKIYNKIPFNSAKSDIWSLGVCLFMMTMGSCPYSIPTNTDAMFNNIYNGYINEWAQDIGKSKYISKSLLDLFDHIFCDEINRFNINKIIKHDYVCY